MSDFKIIFAALQIFCITLSGQNQATKWYFGKKAALDFSTEPPTIMNNSAMLLVTSGCASIADESGNLLFYTDGATVWNKLHVPMANGTGLLGHPFVHQNVVILKKPGPGMLYYIFTLGGPVGAMQHSIIDMSLASGNGSVTVKNTFMITPAGFKICATKHCNGVDYWILVHDINSPNANNFLAFLLTAAGVSATPVISSIGPVYTYTTGNGNQSNAVGVIKLSPNGNKVATSLIGSQLNSFELYDFNNASGVVSNSINLGNFYAALDVEFSPDCSKLYGDYASRLYQWNLCAGSATAIAASIDTIAVSNFTNIGFCGLQLAPNGKIYVSRPGAQSIGVINAPNNPGVSCNFVEVGPSLGTNSCNLSLPNFPSSFLRPSFNFTAQQTCPTVSLSLPPPPSCNTGYSTTACKWFFGDPASGTANTSTLSNPVHVYPAAGTYTVKLAVNYSSCAADTFLKIITVNGPPSLSVTGKQSICASESTTLIVNGANSYSWNTTAVTSSIVVNPTTTTIYTVTGTYTNFPCNSALTVTLTVKPCLGFAENGNDDFIKIYPNPAKGSLFIESEKPAALTIYNQLGEIVFEAKFTVAKNTVDLQDIKPGLYYIKIREGQTTKIQRLVKE